MERFDAMRSSQSPEQIACTLTISSEYLSYLDKTLNELRKRARHRSTDPVADGPELMALRSAAVEVAARAYVDGLRKRRRHGHEAGGRNLNPMLGNARPGLTFQTMRQTRGSRRARFHTIVCALSPPLLADLDEALQEILGGESHGADEPGADVGLEDARSIVVESAIVAWLILRGYSAAAPTGGPPRVWLGVVKYLAGRRRRRGR